MTTLALLVRRDYLTRLRSRGFIIGTILGVLGILALSFIPVLGRLLGNLFSTSIALVGPDPATTRIVQRALAGDYRIAVQREKSLGPALPTDLKKKLLTGTYDAALVAYRTHGGQLGFAYYPVKSAGVEEQEILRRRLLQAVIEADFQAREAVEVAAALHFPFTTINLNGRYRNAAEVGFAQGLVYFLLILLYISVIMYGVYVSQGVIEEKSNRVMEVMIAAVRPDQLLAGKIIGIGALAFTQMLIFAAVAGAMLVVAGRHVASPMPLPAGSPAQAPAGNVLSMLATVPISTIVYLVIFFVLGFFSYSTMFAGVGALASKAEDVQQANGLLIWPLIIAYIVALFAIQAPDKPLMVVFSLVPLFSPMVMFTRVAISVVPVWQVALSIALSLAAIWLFTLLAAKLYRVGVLMYGKPLSPKEVLRALRAPA
jgi:ABC-2 type transport system permease protein